ncbi:ribonuclease H-like YkuK family protein [Clostridium ganghwense]|uniref:Ribonuclease H-like YkuK family protein n=1 Tax=Clostridium ganghwense TaxID=312089 RepID=A0ABT4CJW5_9CLOT|nr:ribonuclease H-like YkuK family protein [Clostridium ganghwense]MCY6369337.1 ribonuclease H-like YkuK family protein [Clostridium ganghwense]
MKSITYGEVSFGAMCKLIKNYISKENKEEYKITVGTDSQNYDITKVVIVVAICRIGKGGIFFYDVKKVNKITNIRQKLFYETSLSIEMATKLSSYFNEHDKKYDISIHVDAGDNGPSSSVIPEITGWVKGCGFNCNTKPNSYAASSIANRYSK